MKHRQNKPELKLILVGGGHAHIHVMHQIRRLRQLADVLLISPAREQLYSGMASGYVEGIYTSSEIAFDLARICEQKQIQWIQGRVCHIDADAQVVTVENGQTYPYDVLSVNTGSEIRDPDSPNTAQTRIKVKPFENLIKLRQILDDASLHTQRAHCTLRTSVLGGGAAGVEMSLAIRSAADRAGWQLEIHLWEKHADILAKYSDRTRHYALEKLQSARIRLHCQASLTDQPETAEPLSDRQQQVDDLVILATGSQASDLFTCSCLPVDGKGYLLVNEFLQSPQHANIFGAGDCISLVSAPDIPKAGVFAIRQSPVLLDNLQCFLQKKPLRQFKPQRRFLSILSTGQQTAILEWGFLSLSGRLPWQFKNLIDRRFMRRYQRVRVLCQQGRIPGVLKTGRSYRIPAHAPKPSDARVKEHPSNTAGVRYLKWNNDVIGTIAPSNDVMFSAPQYNEVVILYTQGADHWTADQFTEFLSERIVSRDRRDIERILFRCGLSHYDVQRIAEVTRGIHPKDLLWIAQSKDETLDSIMTDVFSSVFLQRVDKTGDSIDTPEGYNIKRYGVNDGKYGIYKQRINPLVTDVESEIAVYLLGKRLGVPCCPAVRAGKDSVFSVFLYEYASEYIVHFRRLFAGARSDNEYQNLIAVRPQFRDEIARMILLDFITRQDDRHLSNMAIKVHDRTESFYPLYDNGRSLFYEDTEEMTAQAVSDIEGYSTSFGYSGSYWDYVQEIASERNDIGLLIDLDLRKDEVAKILETAGFRGYRFDGALEWITKACRMLRDL